MRVGLTDRYLTDYPNMYGDLSATSGLNALTRDEDLGTVEVPPLSFPRGQSGTYRGGAPRGKPAPKKTGGRKKQ